MVLIEGRQAGMTALNQRAGVQRYETENIVTNAAASA